MIGNAQISFKVTPSYSKIFVGEETSLTATLTNSGGKTLSGVVISLNLPKELGGQRNVTVSSITAGSSYVKTFKIVTFPTTVPGNYSISYSVTYLDETIDYSGVNIEVTPFPLSSFIHFQNQKIGAGEQNSLIVNVKNTGDETLKDLKVVIDYPGGFITNMTKIISLPELSPFMEVTQEFVFIAPANANGDYYVGVKADFEADDGNVHSTQDYAKLTVVGQPSWGWLETLLTIFIVILIGLILLGKAK
jgi:uncharacterized membrane protein